MGSYFTYELAFFFELDIVLSSAFVSFFLSFIPSIKVLKLDKLSFQTSLYCGSFAGMCSSYYQLNTFHFIALSLIGAFILFLLKSKFKGVGGKLGMIAFVSLFIFLSLVGENKWY